MEQPPLAARLRNTTTGRVRGADANRMMTASVWWRDRPSETRGDTRKLEWNGGPRA